MKHIVFVLALLICSVGFCSAQEGLKATNGIWNEPGSGGTETRDADAQRAIAKPGDNPGGTPVGEGTLFLLALAGGYGLTLFKRRNGSKKESSADL